MSKQANPAQRIDVLLAEVAENYRQLPRCDALPLAFREACAAAGLPGGYVRRNAVPRPLAQNNTLPA